MIPQMITMIKTNLYSIIPSMSADKINKISIYKLYNIIYNK